MGGQAIFSRFEETSRLTVVTSGESTYISSRLRVVTSGIRVKCTFSSFAVDILEDLLVIALLVMYVFTRSVFKFDNKPFPWNYCLLSSHFVSLASDIKK